MLKLAVVAGFPPDKEGEANYSWQVYTELAKRYEGKVRIHVYAHLNKQASPDDRQLPNLQVTRITGGGLSRWEKTKAVYRLYKMLKKDRPDVVHFQGTHTNLYGGLFGEPVTLACLFLRRAGIPTLLTMHSTWMPEEVDQLWRNMKVNPLLAKLLSWYNRKNLQVMVKNLGIYRILTAGEYSPVMAAFVKAYGLKPKALVHEAHACVNKFVSADEEQQAKQKIQLAGKTIILATGFVRPDKGYHLLLDAADQLIDVFSDVCIVIAGNPSGAAGQQYADKMVEQRNQLRHAASVVLKFEYISDEVLDDYLNASDIIAVPYERVIGASGPVHHALGRGKAVIATRKGHNLGLEGTIRLFEANSAHSLQETLTNLLSNKGEMETLKLAAQKYALQHSWQQLATEYVHDYETLTGKQIS